MKKQIYLFLILLFALFKLSYSQIDSTVIDKMDETEKISLLLKAYKNYNIKISDYRIQLFSGSFEQAKKVEKEALDQYPNWPISLDFRSPSYRIRIGAFKSRLEAEKNLIEVRKKYPASVLLKPKKIQ